MMGFEEQLIGVGVYEPSLSHSEPVVLELNRLQNLLTEKDIELGAAHGEIKNLRTSYALKDKAIEELRIQMNKLDVKLRALDNTIEDKNLEIKRIVNEKKEALAAQYAAEATLRRVHANVIDDVSPPIGSFIAPLEAEIKMYKHKIAALQEDKKAMERLNRLKEAALLEAERILKSALERVLIVEQVQNQNYDLKRQIEIYQEENRILEKTNRQKVAEVEKLSRTIEELEETVVASGAAANIVRDHKRQVAELSEEKKILERELARAKVSANRVATVVANEWKDDKGKVMPVKQWLEERRLMQAEMQRVKDKLAISERTGKAEAQLKGKLKLRLQTLEEGLKQASSISTNSNRYQESPIREKSILGFLTSNAGLRKRSASQPRASMVGRGSLLQQANMGTDKRESDTSKRKQGSSENTARKSLWAARSRVVDTDSIQKPNAEKKSKDANNTAMDQVETMNQAAENGEVQERGTVKPEAEDFISGFLYDQLQKEVINLRKACEVKDNCLNAKDQQIQMLMRKVDSLTKSIEAAAKRKKETGSAKLDQSRKTAACTNQY